MQALGFGQLVSVSGGPLSEGTGALGHASSW